jgi:hypothetical protein
MTDAQQPPSEPRPPHTEQDEASQAPADDTVLEGSLTRPISHDTQSGERDYVATNAGGVSAEPGNPLPEDEQGRGTEYDPVNDGPQREG